MEKLKGKCQVSKREYQQGIRRHADWKIEQKPGDTRLAIVVFGGSCTAGSTAAADEHWQQLQLRRLSQLTTCMVGDKSDKCCLDCRCSVPRPPVFIATTAGDWKLN
jgi:hypothetical protein